MNQNNFFPDPLSRIPIEDQFVKYIGCIAHNYPKLKSLAKGNRSFVEVCIGDVSIALIKMDFHYGVPDRILNPTAFIRRCLYNRMILLVSNENQQIVPIQIEPFHSVTKPLDCTEVADTINQLYDCGVLTNLQHQISIYRTEGYTWVEIAELLSYSLYKIRKEMDILMDVLSY